MATTRQFEITEESLKMLGFIRQLEQGDIKPEEYKLENFGDWHEIAKSLYAAYCEGYEQQGKRGAKELVTRAIKANSRADEALATLLQEAVYALRTGTEKDVEKALKSMDAMPSLPSEVSDFLEQDLERVAKARKWLDDFIEWETMWSPRAPHCFHEAIGCWLMSAIAMRRIYIPYNAGMSTNLYILLAADTTKFAKSFTIAKAKKLLEHIGLDYLLHDGRMTPEVFYRKASGRIDSDVESMTQEEAETLMLELAFAAQRPYEYAEFGAQLSSLMQAQGPMKGWHRIFLAWDDNMKRDRNETIGRGGDIVELPYLALLASLTIENIKALPRTMNLWRDGFWARYWFATPDEDDWNLLDAPDGVLTFPENVAKPLIAFHHALRIPRVHEIKPVLNPRTGKETGRWIAEKDPLPINECTFADGVLQRFKMYNRALGTIANTRGLIHPDLAGNYGRHAEKAMRLAALLSWMDPDARGRIGMEHWIAAQQTMERARESMHRFYAQSNGTFESPLKSVEVQMLRWIEAGQKAGCPMRSYEIAQRIRNVTTQQALPMLDSLVQAGHITTWKMRGGKSGTRTFFVYTLANADPPKGAVVDDESEKEKA